MESRAFGLSMGLVVFCVFSLLIQTAVAETSLASSSKQTEDQNETLTRRQDNGFNLMNYFLTGQQQAQQQQQAAVGHQQARQIQPPQAIQQQPQQLSQQQLQQLEQLRQLQQQQVLLQQQSVRANEAYQDNTAQQQQQIAALNRDGGYGQVGIGGGYPGSNSYPPPAKQVGISIGGGRPTIGFGNFLTLLPRIINVLSAGGKVMFGVELGNNFYFGPVGAKPLYG